MTIPQFRLLLWALLFFGAFLNVSNAQEGATIRSINIAYEGARTIDEGRVLANILSKEGSPYSPSIVEKDVVNLVQSGDLDSVNVDVRSVGNGVGLTYRIRAKSLIGAITFQGNQRYDSDRLRDESELKVGQPLTDAALSKAVSGINELYSKKGYPDVLVSYQIQPMQQAGYSVVQFTVQEGARAYVHSIQFNTGATYEGRELRKELQTKRRHFWDVVLGGGKLDQVKLDQDVRTVEHFFQDRGYFDARVVRVDRVPYNDKSVDLVFQIAEGSLYSIVQTSISGAKSYPAADLTPFLLSVPGTLYSLKNIEEDVKNLNDFYGSRGFADVSVTPRLDNAGPNRLKLAYIIEEGQRYYIRQINIAGNTITKDKVLRRELSFAPGDEYNTVHVKASRERLNNLGYFSTVDVRPTETDVPNFKDVNIDVQEKLTGSFNLGAGFSSVDSLVGFFSVAQSNFDLFDWPRFRGAGQKFRFDARYGNKRRDFTISFVEPWFLEQRLALGVDLFYRDIYFYSDYYDQRDAGGTLSLRFPAGDNGFLRLKYTLQSIKLHNFDHKSTPELKMEKGTYTQSKIGLEYVNDTRDSVFLPRKGHRLSAEASVSGGIFGGDVDTYALDFNYEQHWSLPGDTIFTLKGQVGTTDGLNGSDRVPIFDRLFLGGAYNMRGFDYRDVSPKDRRGESLGGQSLGYLTLEYTFPIIEKVRGAVFYDAGFVNRDSWDFSTSDYNSDFGIGLRLYLSSFPINVDFGIPLESSEYNDSSGRFNFTIGFQY